MCTICAAASRATYLTRKETGLCVACKGARDGEGLVCRACKSKRKEARKAIVAKYKARGICVACFKRPGEKVHCGVCREKMNAARAKRKAVREQAHP